MTSQNSDSDTPMNRGDETICRRKERRYKTRDDEVLLCETTVENSNASTEDAANSEPPVHHSDGSVIDISPGGLRLLAFGQFSTGQEFTAELKTDRSHGVYRGIIRRVEPWVGGKVVLGCQLLDKIPEEVLQELSREGVVDRRRDTRVDWDQAAKVSWELRQGELDIQIKDCSPGGLKIFSPEQIPNDKRLRIRVTECDQELMLVEAKAVWQSAQAEGCEAGVAFTKREIPDAVQAILDRHSDDGNGPPSKYRRPSMRRAVIVGTVAVVCIWALTQTALPNILATNVDQLLGNKTVSTFLQNWLSP